MWSSPYRPILHISAVTQASVTNIPTIRAIKRPDSWTARGSLQIDLTQRAWGYSVGGGESLVDQCKVAIAVRRYSANFLATNMAAL